MKTIDYKITELESMKKYPDNIYFIGDDGLLKRKKVSIVGSRKPNQYATQFTYQLASKLSQSGICVVSGGAMGVDALAHKGAGVNNTIMVAGTGLDKRYPAVNKNLIQDIEENGLVISQFRAGVPSARYNFPLRNEVVVALGEVLIVTFADKDSGTMRSVEYALKMKKDIYVLPHRIGESDGTNELLKKGLAKAIYDIDEFVNELNPNSKIITQEKIEDEFLVFCKTTPTYDELVKRFPNRAFEAELSGEIDVKNGRVYLIS